MKYYITSRQAGIGGWPIRLPWPMTPSEAIRWLALTTSYSLFTFGLIIWASFRLIDPSLMRLVPGAVWILVTKIVVAPRVHRFFVPPNLAERYQVMDQE